jgi:cobalt-zinc-cadmium efflux system outer membrane protein
MRHTALWMAGWLALLPALARADSVLTLQEAVALAIQNNAKLKSLRAELDAMQERISQATYLPNPMATYGAMDATSGGDWPNAREKRYMIQQEFPGFGKRGLRSGLAAKDAEILLHEAESAAREIAMNVKENYFELFTAQRIIAVTREEDQNLQHMELAAEAMYASGQRPLSEVLAVQAERILLKQKLLDLETRKALLEAQLNTLLNRPVDSPMEPVAEPPQHSHLGDVAAFLALALTNRPEVLAARAKKEKYDLERRLARKEYTPDFKVGLEYRDMGDDMLMFTVGVDLPLWRTKTRSSVREAEKMTESSQWELEAAQRQAALDVRDASLQLESALRALELYQAELVPKTEARVNSIEAEYRAGRAKFMDLLESRRALLNARMMLIMTEGAVLVQSARWERAIGADLFVRDANERPSNEPTDKR